MNTLNRVNENLSKTVLKLTFLLLVQAICNTESYYSIQRDHGKVTWSFPKDRSPNYHERLALAGQVLAQNTKNVKQEPTVAATAEDFVPIFRTIENYFILPSENWHLKSDNSLRMADKAKVSVMELDSVIGSLSDLAESGAVSSRCINDTGYLLISMLQRQGWALKFLDAAGKPGPGLSQIRLNFVGDYDLCRSQGSNGSETFKGNYVTWKMSVGPINPKNPTASPIIQWGVCMPDTCTDMENTLFVFEAVQYLGLNGTLNVLQAESHTDHRELSVATVVSIVILCIIGSLVFGGTFYDVIFLQWPRWRKQWIAKEEENRINTFISSSEGNPSRSRSPDDDDVLLIAKNDMEETTSILIVNPDTGRLVKALVAFSVYTNGFKILNITQQPDSISCIHGIRFFSMSWVILGHVFSFGLAYFDNLVSAIPDLVSRWTFDAIANAFVSVDTFFALSGILVSYLSVMQMRQKGWKLNWGLFYFHRFWRLTPPYILVMVLILGLQQYCGKGPLWESVQPSDKVVCEKYWWTNLLYINNLVHSNKVCLAQSWYLSNDMQFFVISPLMIIPFHFNTFLGLGSCSIFFLAHGITTAVLSAQHKWGASPISEARANDFQSYFMEYYEAPWCRIGPYIVGIVTGYLLATKRDSIKLNWITATIGWTVATAVALSVVYGLRGDIKGTHLSSVAVAALYNALARSAWGACICWVIIACVAGWGGFVNSFLSWSPFVVLGRLTYMAYLIHVSLINIYFGNQQTAFHFTIFNIAMAYISIMVGTYGVSFFLMLALESPMISLEKLFLPQRNME